MIQGFLQGRYEDTRLFSDTTFHGEPRTPGDKILSSGFRLRRLRLRLSAHWRTGTAIRIQLALQQTIWNKVLEDAFLQQNLMGSRLRITLGQLKVPYGREELRSSGNQLVVDRGYLTGVLVSNNWASRQLGLMVRGSLEPLGLKTGLQLMVANGDGINQKGDPTPLAKLAVGRLTLQPFSWLEVAVGMGLQHFGAGGIYFYSPTPLPESVNLTTLGLDFNVRLYQSGRALLQCDGEVHSFDLIHSFDVGQYPRFGWSGYITHTQERVNRGEFQMLGINLTPSLYLRLPTGPVKAVDLAARFEHARTGKDFYSTTGFSFIAGEVALGLHFKDSEQKNLSRLQLALELLSPSIARPTQDQLTITVQWQVRY